jgi:hypothetical protein
VGFGAKVSMSGDESTSDCIPVDVTSGAGDCSRLDGVDVDTIVEVV